VINGCELDGEAPFGRSVNCTVRMSQDAIVEAIWITTELESWPGDFGLQVPLGESRLREKFFGWMPGSGTLNQIRKFQLEPSAIPPL